MAVYIILPCWGDVLQSAGVTGIHIAGHCARAPKIDTILNIERIDGTPYDSLRVNYYLAGVVTIGGEALLGRGVMRRKGGESNFIYKEVIYVYI